MKKLLTFVAIVSALGVSMASAGEYAQFKLIHLISEGFNTFTEVEGGTERFVVDNGAVKLVLTRNTSLPAPSTSVVIDPLAGTTTMTVARSETEEYSYECDWFEDTDYHPVTGKCTVYNKYTACAECELVPGAPVFPWVEAIFGPGSSEFEEGELLEGPIEQGAEL